MTIPISGDFLPPERVPRQRVAPGGTGKAGPTTAGSGQDQADILSSNPETVKSYVQTLKAMNPVDLHRVEQLRQRIRSGAYQADPETMAAPLAEILSRERAGQRGA